MIRPAASHCCDPAGTRADVTRSPLGFLLWYGLPIAAISATGHLLPDPRLLGLTWAGAFGVMGGKCLANVRHCGRVHCYFTGPWFLLAALASLLLGFNLAPTGWLTWDWIANGALIGAALLWCGSEGILGRYRRLAPP